MITVLIAKDEGKIKEMLIELLQKEGYGFLQEMEQKDIIKIIKKDGFADESTLKDKIIDLEKSLYKEKKGVLYKSILEIIEKPLIEHILERTEGNQLKAARILGLNRNTIRTKIKKLGIDVSKWKMST